MKELPGRKAVVLATDGFPILERDAGRADGLFTLRPRVTAGDQAVGGRCEPIVRGAARGGYAAAGAGRHRDGDVRLRRRRRQPQCRSAFSRLTDFEGDGPALVAQSGGGLYLRNSNDLTGLFTQGDERPARLLPARLRAGRSDVHPGQEEAAGVPRRQGEGRAGRRRASGRAPGSSAWRTRICPAPPSPNPAER